MDHWIIGSSKWGSWIQRGWHGCHSCHRIFGWNSSDLEWFVSDLVVLISSKLHGDIWHLPKVETDFKTLPMSQNLNVPKLNKQWRKMGRTMRFNQFWSPNFFNFPGPERNGASFWGPVSGSRIFPYLSGIWQLWLSTAATPIARWLSLNSLHPTDVNYKEMMQKNGMGFDVSWSLHAEWSIWALHWMISN